MTAGELEKTVEDIIVFMSLSERRQPSRRDRGGAGNEFANFGISSDEKSHHVDLSEFDGADPIFTGEETRQGFFMDAIPHDVDNHVDSCLITTPDDGDCRDGRKGKYTIQRIRSVPMCMFRGKKITGTHALERNVAFVFEDGTFETWRLYSFFAGRGRDGRGLWSRPEWHTSLLRRDREHGDLAIVSGFASIDEEDTDSLNAAVAAEFTKYYEWSVHLRIGEGPSIRFVTDPEGAKEVFRLRDVAAGSSRRSALRNWVNQHWRKNRKADDMAIVRQHLRGETVFRWAGMDCKVVPSAYDINLYQRIMGRRAS